MKGESQFFASDVHLTPDNAAELAALLNSQAVTREHREENKLWQDWTTLMLFLILLTAEWVGRKLAGLP